MTDFILLDIDGGIATVTINRAEKKNAMSFAMLGDFIATIKRAGEHPDARVVIVTGVPGAFCAGTDLSDLNSVPGAERGLRGTAEERGRWWPIVECPLPVIGAIDGPAVGMGAEFASQCDIRIATPRARFAWNFVHRGLVPDTGAGSWLLPRLIGTGHALRLLYTGEFLAAQQAFDLGFVHQIVEPDQLATTARELAAAIARGSPFSQKRIKSLVYEGLASPVDEHMQRHTRALAECFRSEDHREGVASFLERREARFTGR